MKIEIQDQDGEWRDVRAVDVEFQTADSLTSKQPARIIPSSASVSGHGELTNEGKLILIETIGVPISKN